MKRLIKAALHDREKLRHLRPWRRHSLVLTVLGIIYFLVGLSAVVNPPTTDREQALVIALHVMPLWAWGTVFMISGLLAVLSSRWPMASETWGYAIMSGLSTLWGSWYVWGVVYGAPPSTISGALTWGGLAFLWWAISGLVNPVPSDHDREDGPKPW